MTTPNTPAMTVDEAVRAAAGAAAPLRRAAPTDRARWLTAAADALDGAAARLLPLAQAESHLPEGRLTGELARTTAQLRLFATALEEGSFLEATIDHPDASATPPIPDLRRLLVPLGPVAIYAASNFPFAFSVAGGDTASALAAGCPVVLKAHPGHPELSRATAAILTEALHGAGAPDGAFALVEGFDAGVELIEHPQILAAAFTGSLAGGRALADRAAARPAPIPFFGELGSLNPVVVTPGADAARGAELAAGLAGSFTLGAGQFCTKPGMVLLPEGSALESHLLGEVPGTAQAMLTETIGERYTEHLTALAAREDVEVLRASTGSGDPAVLATGARAVATDPAALGAEVFGPVTLLVRYRDPADLDAALAALEGSLTATLHSEPEEAVSAILERLSERAGRVLFSGWPTGVAVSWAQHHGGPWPATTSQHTSVGVSALRRFQRPIAYQEAPEQLLPEAVQESNPWRIPRRVDGVVVLP